MFHGCKNLKKIKFGEFEPQNLYNISNMFAGCEKLETVDVDIFTHGKLKDIYGCSL